MKSMTTTLTAAALLVLATGCSTSDPGDASETPDAMTGNNPFFTESTLPYQLPPFDRIDESHYRPAFERGMAEQIEEIDAIAGASEPPTVENMLIAMERSGRLLDRVASTFFSLSAADTNDALNDIRTEVAPALAGMMFDAVLPTSMVVISRFDG